MTDFEKVRKYYGNFDERGRLERPEGRLEYVMTLDLIMRHIDKRDSLLDLGGGAGAYSFTLARAGFRVTLADLSERLLGQAREEIASGRCPPLEAVDLVNATDLGRYPSGSFGAVLLLGPLYHLTGADERRRCVAEVARVLRPGGVVIASFIPYLSGISGAVSRALLHPEQLDSEGLSRVFESGELRNKSPRGFQEGYYPASSEVAELFEAGGFTACHIRSLRGFMYNKEETLYKYTVNSPELFDKIIGMINSTATDPAIIETCGHAVYIGKKLGAKDI